MKQLTAVEWLQEAISKKVNNELGPYFIDLFDNAKAMEKEQIIKAYEYTAAGTSHYGEQYYNKIYKTL
jgi:isopentenyldiphosphate isomerase